MGGDEVAGDPVAVVDDRRGEAERVGRHGDGQQEEDGRPGPQPLPAAAGEAPGAVQQRVARGRGDGEGEGEQVGDLDAVEIAAVADEAEDANGVDEAARAAAGDQRQRHDADGPRDDQSPKRLAINDDRHPLLLFSSSCCCCSLPLGVLLCCSLFCPSCWELNGEKGGGRRGKGGLAPRCARREAVQKKIGQRQGKSELWSTKSTKKERDR